jgi:concanavalin A-like lectin/glucanase superfamily protein/FecR-like protein
MKLFFPSREFDDAVMAVCHGQASDGQMRGMNELLRADAIARDEYILRLEIHSRLASNTDLFVSAIRDEANAVATTGGFAQPKNVLRPPPQFWNRKLIWALAMAACIAVLAAGFWGFLPRRPVERKGAASKAIAMLNRTVEAKWNQSGETPRLGTPLEPGQLRLESGLAQIVFYSGARVVIEGPAQLELVSQTEVSFSSGRLTAEVPPQARGFLIRTAQAKITDSGTSVGLDVKKDYTELHVFKGNVELQPVANRARQLLQEGGGAVLEGSQALRLITANPAAFASLFDLNEKSLAAETQRYGQWRVANGQLNRDPSLLVHLDFENVAPSDWRLHNSANSGGGISDATIVGCQWITGRWPNKRALEFQSVNDRVRLTVPGQFNALTLAAWVRVQGVDRPFNSLFMSDGFEPGEIHWMLLNDGVLGLTLKGPGQGNFEILSSSSGLSLDRLGLWVHLAFVLDGNTKRVIHYVNGRVVSERPLRLDPPFRIGAAELGNWNPGAFAGGDDSFLIRNFSGAMDEFCLFGRSLSDAEIFELYAEGRPGLDL